MNTTIELAITVGVLIAEIICVVVCYYKAKQPVDPLNPRIFPYAFAMVMLSLAVLATLAHVISLVTGQQVQPRRRRGM